jgi:hypothetical protein
VITALGPGDSLRGDNKLVKEGNKHTNKKKFTAKKKKRKENEEKRKTGDGVPLPSRRKGKQGVNQPVHPKRKRTHRHGGRERKQRRFRAFDTTKTLEQQKTILEAGHEMKNGEFVKYGKDNKYTKNNIHGIIKIGEGGAM